MKTKSACTTSANALHRSNYLCLITIQRASGLPAVSYHAGMDSDQRRKTQEQFDSGVARVVVATVAFGMGVDKGEQGGKN